MNFRTDSQLRALREANDASAHSAFDRVVGALNRLAGEKEWEKIAVTDIVRESGVARSALYRHFRSRDDVVEQLTASMREAVLAADIDAGTEGWQHVF